MKKVSVVVPVFNESAGIKKFLDKELIPNLKKVKLKIEVILVDDGSQDDSVKKIKKAKICEAFPVKVICFSRNFGKEIALSAGIKSATGDAIILIDADGQHPAKMIPKMIGKWKKGAMVVTAVRGQNTTKHKFGSRMYYWLMNKMGNNVVMGAMDFRLIDRTVADEFNRFSENNRLARGLIDWLGFSQEYIKVETKDRLGGEPSYSFKRLAMLASDSLVSMSRMPLLIFGYIGGFIMAASFLLGIFILIQQYILGDPLNLDWSGAVAMSVFIAFLVGIVLVSQSITALYISQIHIESKKRPLYVIDKNKSFESKKNHAK